MKRPIRYNILLMLLFLLLMGTICILPLLIPAADVPAGPADTAASSTQETTSTTGTTSATVPPTNPPTTVPPTTVPPVTISPTVEITAKNAFVYNCTRDYTAYIKDAGNTVMYPASITKLFTVYVALQYLAPTQQVTVGRIILTVPPDSSFAQLKEGDVFTVEDLVAAMLLRSGGDAARVLAVEAGRAIAGDAGMSESAAMERFVTEMNHTASQLGMTNTHFVNPDGYHHEDHYTCLQDLLTIGKLSLATDLIRETVCMTEYSVTLTADRTLTWKNTNLLMLESDVHYCASAIGMKTGYTGAAGSCLMAAFEKNGEFLLVGIFGSETKMTRFTDAVTLFQAYE
jgi:D-alanyl-D-alanine carboxypeptidase (penicillin-binding protein 5/6)